MSVHKRWVVFNPKASDDLRSILLYTRARWGSEQRSRYRVRLNDGIKNLSRYPELGHERNDLFFGCRELRVEQHVFFYRVSENEIVISRVLHINQDASGIVTP